MKTIIGLAIFLVSFNSFATLKIAVIDTGFHNGNVKFCKVGHKDFTGKGLITKNVIHGQNVINVIADILGDADYCIVNIKFLDESVKESNNLRAAIMYAREINADVINISAGGPALDIAEQIVVKRILNEGKTVVASAGNEKANLDENCNYFPACADERVITVGSMNKEGEISKFSNYGNYVRAWEVGENVYGGGVTLSGTSQAAAKRTGYYSKHLLIIQAKKLIEDVNKTIFKYIFYK